VTIAPRGLRIYQWQGRFANFGDDLNAWFWDRLVPELRDNPDDVLLVGIGTVLKSSLPAAARTVIAGSGVGYGRPFDVTAPTVDVRFVRGPLTARTLGLDDRWITDPALLVAGFPEFATDDDLGTIFVPHWESAAYGRWSEVAARAGVHYVDPRDDAHAVIAQIARARHVLAESMHAAIIADAFGKRWTPVVTSPRVLPFKWVDWCASMEVAYAPRQLPASSLAEQVYKSDRRARRSVLPTFTAAATFAEWERLQGSGGANTPGWSTLARRRFGERLRRRSERRWLARWDAKRVAFAATALAELRADPGLCSVNAVRERRRDALERSLDGLRRDYGRNLA
jgi:succinoglycan biosynthesis protein ExoV